MTNLKRVFLVMMIVFLLGATVVLATDGDSLVIGDDDPQNTTNTTNTTTIDSGNTTQNTANTSTYNATNTNGNLPQTGENDYIYVLVIGAFAISAVYAYRKIVDYKNI